MNFIKRNFLALMLAMSVLSAFLPQEGWLNIANFVKG